MFVSLDLSALSFPTACEHTIAVPCQNNTNVSGNWDLYLKCERTEDVPPSHRHFSRTLT